MPRHREGKGLAQEADLGWEPDCWAGAWPLLGAPHSLAGFLVETRLAWVLEDPQDEGAAQRGEWASRHREQHLQSLGHMTGVQGAGTMRSKYHKDSSMLVQ